MYESPITQILGEMQVTYENDCLKAVQSYGFDVNKEELTKALQYDRGQYDKGYKDGYEKAIEDFAEALKNETENYEFANFLESSWTHTWAILHFKSCVDEIAEELKGVTHER